MIIQYKLTSLNTFGILKNNRKDIRKSSKKLSSGVRISTAADDAAGMAISEKMRAQIRGLSQASRNTQDAISMTNVIDGGLGEIRSILQRMRELSVMTLNGTLTDIDREMVQKEYINLKEEINHISYNTEFNTIKAYENHKDKYEQFTGNRVLEGQLTVIEGVTDYLGIWVDGQFKEIYLDAGVYNRDTFLDMLDDKLWEVDKNLIPSINDDFTLSISAENYKRIDGIVGGALGFFYEYHIGMGPGVVYGSSDLSGKLDIINGSNNQFIFDVEGERYVVNFQPTPSPPYIGNGYTAEEIVNIMQTQLDNQNADVKVYMNGNQIAIDAGYRIIDGFAGNMIKIDGITSILYDNAKHGEIRKTQGYYEGRVPINSLTPIKIEEGVNDAISFYLDGDEDIKYEVTLTAGNYTSASQIRDEINKQLGLQDINAEAKTSSNKIALYSKTKGEGSKVRVTSACNAYNTLFRYVEETEPTYVPGSFSPAQIMGRNGILQITKIYEGINDTLILEINGEDESIILQGGDYTKQELEDELNRQLEGTGVIANISGGGSNLTLIYDQSTVGDYISVDTSSNAYLTLLCANSPPTYTSGYTRVTPPPEGSTQPTYEYTPAKVQSGRAISGLTITEDNDTLSFNVSGESINIKLEHKTYTAAGLREELEKKINQKTDNVLVGLNGNRIYLETRKKGDGQKFSNLDGKAYKDIFTTISEPYSKQSYSSESPSYARGRKNITNNITIDENNRDLQFDYLVNGEKSSINIRLDEGSYNKETLVTELNKKLGGKGVKAEKYVDLIQLVCAEPGPDYEIRNLSGGLYEEIFLSKEVKNPSDGEGATTLKDTETYIVGRKDISNGVVINPGINDTLVFDLRHNDEIVETISITITAEHYTSDDLVNEINTRLQEKGIDNVKAEYGTVNTGTTADDSNKLVLRYLIGDEEGSYIIDGVRGNSAYSIFYNASGEPIPTYTTGIVDLSNGAEIVAGENDIFSFDIDGEENTIILSEGSYDADMLLEEINGQLTDIGASITASYYEGRLKLSYNAIGFHTIDNIRGNARETLFMGMEGRDESIFYSMQVGANTGNTMEIEPFYIGSELLRVNTILASSAKSSEKALNRIDFALKILSEQSGRVGAYQNRLEHTIRNLDNSAENLQAAESRIRDADMAKEMLEITKLNILEQATMAMLAQANTDSQKVLLLLG